MILSPNRVALCKAPPPPAKKKTTPHHWEDVSVTGLDLASQSGRLQGGGSKTNGGRSKVETWTEPRVIGGGQLCTPSSSLDPLIYGLSQPNQEARQEGDGFFSLRYSHVAIPGDNRLQPKSNTPRLAAPLPVFLASPAVSLTVLRPNAAGPTFRAGGRKAKPPNSRTAGRNGSLGDPLRQPTFPS